MTAAVRVGTQGWAYDAWDGLFYPAGLAAGQRLSTYARAFPAVEVNSTFYAAPPDHRFREWAADTPPGFRFCVKVPGEITHEARLEGHPRRLASFWHSARVLGERLGLLLVQLPPDFGPERREVLAGFLDEAPEGAPLAVEFRDPGWHAPETWELLDRRGTALAVSQGRWLGPRPAMRAVRDAPGRTVYVRWMGGGGELPAASDAERPVDRTRELDAWAGVLAEEAERREAVYGFFNDEYEGHAPASARRLQERLGQEPVSPAVLTPQRDLFRER